MNLDHLEVWKRARDFAVQVYKEVVPLLPTSEKYNLSDQLKRAATSIPANIAERQFNHYWSSNSYYLCCEVLNPLLNNLQIITKMVYYYKRLIIRNQKQITFITGVS